MERTSAIPPTTWNRSDPRIRKNEVTNGLKANFLSKPIESATMKTSNIKLRENANAVMTMNLSTMFTIQCADGGQCLERAQEIDDVHAVEIDAPEQAHQLGPSPMLPDEGPEQPERPQYPCSRREPRDREDRRRDEVPLL